jgi:hypothetical protein
MSSTELAEIVDAVPAEHSLLFPAPTPEAMMSLAGQTAWTIKQAIIAQGLSMTIGNSEHVLNTGWQMAANTQRVVTERDEGVTELDWPTAILDQIVDNDGTPEHPLRRAYRAGQAFGYRASFVAKRDGQIVGWGEARCDRTERNWRTSENNAIASMAQTRAQSKALRQPLAWVIGLAGYSPTPAEEMPQTSADEPTGPATASDELEAQALATLQRLAPSNYSALSYFDALRKNFDGAVPEIAARAIVGIGLWIDAQERRLAADAAVAADEPTTQE